MNYSNFGRAKILEQKEVKIKTKSSQTDRIAFKEFGEETCQQKTKMTNKDVLHEICLEISDLFCRDQI